MYYTLPHTLNFRRGCPNSVVVGVAVDMIQVKIRFVFQFVLSTLYRFLFFSFPYPLVSGSSCDLMMRLVLLKPRERSLKRMELPQRWCVGRASFCVCWCDEQRGLSHALWNQKRTRLNRWAYACKAIALSAEAARYIKPWKVCIWTRYASPRLESATTLVPSITYSRERKINVCFKQDQETADWPKGERCTCVDNAQTKQHSKGGKGKDVVPRKAK